jgi:hypothetical protein
MELDLQCLFESCVQLYSLKHRNSPLTPHLGSYTRALLVSQGRRHLFVTPTLYQEPAVFGKMKMDPMKRAQTQNAGEV